MKILLSLVALVAALYALYAYYQPNETNLPAPQPNFQSPPPNRSAPATTETAATTSLAPLPAPEPEFKELVDPFALRIKIKEFEVKPQPKAAPTEPKEAPPALPKLEGIWWDTDMRIAFISGQAVPVGGTVMNWKVTAIYKDRVIIRKGSSEKTLKMEEK
ncbi:MAG: hypothetical protein KKC80_01595 [Candidatus Margulisbacteria bacterium]|nr:hypothetical protein [Candidatus Margulisiibacteriota bacterium]MBU1617570.1 hypothetical protein [Candidatus Margulisiibacteriota bacterium]